MQRIALNKAVITLTLPIGLAGCDPFVPSDTGRPDWPAMPGERFVKVQTVTTAGNCRQDAYFDLFDRPDRFDFHYRQNSDSWGVFSLSTEDYASFAPTYAEGDLPNTYSLYGISGEIETLPIQADGTRANNIEIHVSHTLTVRDGVDAVVDASVRVICRLDRDCEPYFDTWQTGDPPFECAFQRAYIYEYSEDLEDLIPLREEWVED